jgi:catechol 2,3-dioxygenase-like lactoylglutathione lyase family enzyme
MARAWHARGVITSTHAIVYAEDPDRARRFLRDVLGLPWVDAHGGWLIFKLPPAELGVHPAGTPDAPVGGPPSGHHELYLMCDDIESTVAELSLKGVEFAGPIEDQGFGRVVRLFVPGAGAMGLYQPRHPTAFDLEG